MEIGAQFYTIRDFCKNLEDFSESLKKVADIGYKNVQISGCCDYDSKWLDEQLKLNGLKCVITHYNPDRIMNDTDAVVNEHTNFGCNYIGLGCMPGGLNEEADYNNFVANFKDSAQRIAKHGLLLSYHNHQFEFMKAADNKRYIEKMAEDFLPSELAFTLDTYWMQYAGCDPALWIEKLSGRVPCIHLKDMACIEKTPHMAVIGEGNINFERVFLSAQKAGTKFMLVEQDDCYGEDPFDCLKRSYQYLKSCGFN